MITHLHHKDGAEETRSRVEAAGRRALVLQLDQRDPAQVARLFEEAEAKLGTPDILVNNAGIDSAGKQVGDMPLEDWDAEMRTNL